MSERAAWRVGSVFSGIGGFDEAFRRAGFELAWMCEREPFCRKVLARHFPDVPCFEDVTMLTDAPVVDLLVGGFPCQDVSVAGQRRGLSGERSGLFYEFTRLLRLLRPTWCVIENVDGLLSNGLGADFAAVLSEMADVGYVGAWRVLDSQWFGVPQRRERVFLVGHSRDRAAAQAVLFEPACGERNSQASQQARARVAATLRGRSAHAGVNVPGRGGEDDENLIACTLRNNQRNTRWDRGPRGDGSDNIIADTLLAPNGGQRTTDLSGNFQVAPMGVRRLTPLECERLQGFPDGWTCLCGRGHRGSRFCVCPDTPRYKALGNAVTVSVVRWILERLKAVQERAA